MKESFDQDLVIIGAGPAGLAASIYASRYGIRHLIIGRILGGQISETHEIDNYPGMENMSGFEFSQKWGEHVRKYGAEINPGLVADIRKRERSFEIGLDNEQKIETRAILLATGTKRRRLDVQGEKKFNGKGVSYCATCDGFFYKDKIVAVIGGSDSAASSALHLASICRKVYIVYRKNFLRAEPYWIRSLAENPKIEIIYNTNILEIIGSDKVKKIKLDKPYLKNDKLGVEGVFMEIGAEPDILYAEGLGIEVDTGGYVKIGKDGATSVAGVWAAGDITDGSDKFRQVITAASEGAIAVRSIFNWLKL